MANGLFGAPVVLCEFQCKVVSSFVPSFLPSFIQIVLPIDTNARAAAAAGGGGDGAAAQLDMDDGAADGEWVLRLGQVLRLCFHVLLYVHQM